MVVLQKNRKEILRAGTSGGNTRQFNCGAMEVARKILHHHSLGNIGISLFCHHASAIGISIKEVAGEFAKFIGETSNATERLAAAHHFFIYFHRACAQDLLFADTTSIDSFLNTLSGSSTDCKEALMKFCQLFSRSGNEHLAAVVVETWIRLTKLQPPVKVAEFTKIANDIVANYCNSLSLRFTLPLKAIAVFAADSRMAFKDLQSMFCLLMKGDKGVSLQGALSETPQFLRESHETSVTRMSILPNCVKTALILLIKKYRSGDVLNFNGEYFFTIISCLLSGSCPEEGIEIFKALQEAKVFKVGDKGFSTACLKICSSLFSNGKYREAFSLGARTAVR